VLSNLRFGTEVLRTIWRIAVEEKGTSVIFLGLRFKRYLTHGVIYRWTVSFVLKPRATCDSMQATDWGTGTPAVEPTLRLMLLEVWTPRSMPPHGLPCNRTKYRLCHSAAASLVLSCPAPPENDSAGGKAGSLPLAGVV